MKKLYVERDDSNDIIGLYGCKQKGKNLELLDSDDAEVLAFKNPPETVDQKKSKSLADGGYGTPLEILEMVRTGSYAELKTHLTTIHDNLTP